MIVPYSNRHELALVAGSTVGALLVLWLIGTQVYTEPWTIDPWLYTAFMTNFDVAYGWFHTTYYASRLPQIIPGLVLNSFLSPSLAYVILHLTFFLAGGVFSYLLIRRLYGMRVALFAFPAFLVNAAYVDAHTWDYFDGFVITYLLGSLYFLASAIDTASRIRISLAGVFAAAAVSTNLFAALLVAGAVAAYIYTLAHRSGRLAVRRIPVDAAWFAVGAIALLAACGLFAATHGGRFLFFMNAIEALGEIDPKQWKLESYSWIRAEPRLLIPVFVASIAAFSLRSRRSASESARFGVALTVIAVMIFALLVAWEFGRSGTFLQLGYYFSTLYPLLFVAVATLVYGFVERSRAMNRLRPAVLAAVGLGVGVMPLIVIYGLDQAELAGERGTIVTGVLMAVCVGIAVLERLTTHDGMSQVLASLAAVLVVASVALASSASASTYVQFETANSELAQADETFAIGVQLMAFMRQNDLEDSIPAFWYDSSEDAALTGIQSLYFYGYTLLNVRMPAIDDDFRARLEEREPAHVVLLCTDPRCRYGATAMRRAGYNVTERAAARLSAGSKSVWVRAFTFGMHS